MSTMQEVLYENPKGEYFPLLESEGFDRRYTVLEISTEIDEDDAHRGEVYDTVTGQILWRGHLNTSEWMALEEAEFILNQLETIYGFGSISLYDNVTRLHG